MLSKLLFSRSRNTTCLIGVRVWYVVASTAAGSAAVIGSGGALSCWPVWGSTVPFGGWLGEVVGVGEDACCADGDADEHANATRRSAIAAAASRTGGRRAMGRSAYRPSIARRPSSNGGN